MTWSPKPMRCGSSSNRLKSFCRCLKTTLVLPSHGKPFRGLHTRVKQLQDHHRDRLAEVSEVCSKSAASAADILPVMFKRELDLHQTTFAMGEALAHLQCAVAPGATVAQIARGWNLPFQRSLRTF